MTQNEKNLILTVKHPKKWDAKEMDPKVVLDLRASARIGNIGTTSTKSNIF